MSQTVNECNVGVIYFSFISFLKIRVLRENQSIFSRNSSALSKLQNYDSVNLFGIIQRLSIIYILGMSTDCPSKRMTIFPKINNEKLTIFHLISKKFPVEGLRTPVQPFHHGFRDALIDMRCGPLPSSPTKVIQVLASLSEKTGARKIMLCNCCILKDVTTLMSKCNRGIHIFIYVL